MNDTINQLTQIIRETCREYQVTFEQLKARRGDNNIVNARASAMYRMRHDMGMTLTKVGEAFGKDHSTVISALKRYKQYNNQ